MLIDPADSAQRSTTAMREAPAIARILHLLSVTDRQALVVWAFTRAYVFLIALAVGWLLTDNGATAGFFDLFVQWDVHHYWGIAAWGYGGEPTGVPNEAFFPAMPALMWLGATVLPLSPPTAGLVVSLVGSAIAAVALSRLARLEHGPRAAAPTVLVWMLAPPAVFLATAYTESLFLALAIPAWLAARRGHWPLAGVLAAGAMTVRVSGLFLAIALLVEFLCSPRRRWPELAWLTLPGVVLLGWMLYLRIVTGDWLAWLHAQQEEWSRSFTWPWVSLLHTWEAAFGGVFGPAWSWAFRAELAAMIIGCVGTVWLLSARRWSEATWVGLQVAAFATSYWFFSVPRATLLWWPLWIAFGAAAVRRRWLLWLYVAVSAPLSVLWAVAYFTGHWAG
jgi:Mannosyltransferase (PIG-V)